MPIKSFKCTETESLFKRQRVKRFTNIESVARRKLEQLEWAGILDDLRVPPGNRLEALKHDRAGQHSIRINDQFRVCFVWTSEGPKDVEIVDYQEIGVPAQRISEIVAGRRAITADTDLRLCRFFGLSEGWWLRGQARYDTERAKDVLAATLKKIRPWTEVVADAAAHA
jgi:proteic killer suppression protein